MPIRLMRLMTVALLLAGLAPGPARAGHEGVAAPAQIRTTPGGLRYLATLDAAGLALCPSCPHTVNTDPRFVPAAQAQLGDADVVLGVRVGGVARAYPARLLSPPPSHIINDVIGGVPVAVTWCPLCHSGIVFERPQVDGRLLELATAGLYRGDLVMFDVQTASLWQQVTGEVLAGPLVGRAGRLHYLPADLVLWAQWKQAYPATDVLVGWRRADETGRLAAYRELAPGGRGSGTAGVSPDARLPAQTVVVGVVLNGRAKAYPRDVVERRQVIHDTVGGVEIVVVRHSVSGEVKVFRRRVDGVAVPLTFEVRAGRLVDQQTETVWSFDGAALSGSLQGKALREIPAITAYWFAWATFFPETDLFR